MNAALLILLALLWAVFLLPGALRARRSSPTSSVGTFENAMERLARGGTARDRSKGRYVYVPRDAERIVGDRARRRREVILRRRHLFVRLLVASFVLVPIAVFFGGPFWLMLLASLAALALYAGLLRRWKLQSDQAAEVVRELPDVVSEPFEERHEEQYAAVGGGFAPESQRVQVVSHPAEPWQPQSGVRIRRFDDHGSVR